MFLSFKFFKFKRALSTKPKLVKSIQKIMKRKVINKGVKLKNKKEYKGKEKEKYGRGKVIKKGLKVHRFNKNKHKNWYGQKPFLKREIWPRKLKNLMAKWRWKKGLKKRNKYMWLKFQKKKIFKRYFILKRKWKKFKLSKSRKVRVFSKYKYFKTLYLRYKRRGFF